jgi:uncharacterized protein (TIGR00369 family)
MTDDLTGARETVVDRSTEDTIARLNGRTPGTLVGLLGIEIVAVGDDSISGKLPIRPELLAPNGYLHAGTVVTFADTMAGYGCWTQIPDGATGFTTIEMKTNFLGTVRSGTLLCTATLRHAGRSTQVWDADVTDEGGKTIAPFRCTQMILYPRVT